MVSVDPKGSVVIVRLWGSRSLQRRRLRSAAAVPAKERAILPQRYLYIIARVRLLISEKPNNFDAIRIAMAVLVIWSHSFALFVGSEASEPVSRLTHGVVNAGNVAVDVFFVVSGFLITQSLHRSRSWWSFLRKRIARIYPGYLTATSVCAFVVLPLYAGTHYSFADVAKTFGMNLLLRNWFLAPNPFIHNSGTALNGSLWSIPLEFWCYIGVLLFGLLRVRRTAVAAAFVCTLGLHVWTVAVDKSWGGGILNVIFGWPNFWFRMAPFFMAGMLFHLYRERVPRSGVAVAAGVLAFVVCSWVKPLAAVALLPAVMAYVVFYVAFSRQLFRGAKYGDFSYGTYLYAFPIQQLLVALTSVTFPIFVAMSMILSVAAGAVSWFAVERWFHKTREPVSIVTKEPPIPTVSGASS
ncbi:MAG TPA: acyltransferase [Steroidobacteraceae bacterium]|nr:acyltransferase [Steroidobacteraceae bacterium]